MQITKIRVRKSQVRGVLVLGLCCFISLSAYAEGSKTSGGNAHGVNRFVYTKSDPGYVGIKGNVSITYNIPTQHFLPIAPNPLPKGPNPDYPSPDALVSETKSFITHATNPFDDKPSVYFGARLKSPSHVVPSYTIQVDAGIQLETNTFPETGMQAAYGGWSAFISASTSLLPTNPRMYDSTVEDGVPWRGNNGIVKADVNLRNDRDEQNKKKITKEKMAAGSSSISTLMEFDVTLQSHETSEGNEIPAGGVSLSITGEGPGKFYWNPPSSSDSMGKKPTFDNPLAPWRSGPKSIFNTSRLDDISVKRVVAMTRRKKSETHANSAYQLDGSSMTGTFSGGQVHPYGHDWVDMKKSVVDQGPTGYDAPANGTPTARDRLWPYDGKKGGFKLPESQTIVEFPGKHNVAMRASSYYPDDYSDEKVNINLNTVSRPVGDAVKIPGQ